MKFMKPLSLILWGLVLTAFLGSCDKTEPSAKRVEKTPQQECSSFDLRAADVAEGLANLGLTPEDLMNLSTVAKDNSRKGYDELIFLEDMISDRSEDLREEKEDFFSRLKSELTAKASALRSGGEFVPDESVISQLKEMTLYWPYVGNWDMTAYPVVAYVDENVPEDATQIKAYKLDNSGKVVGTIIIDEEYAEKNPVLIVEKKRKPEYMVLQPKTENSASSNTPIDLSKIVGVLGDSFYTGSFNHHRPIIGEITGGFEMPEKKKGERVVALKLGKVKCTKQWDSWVRGGSEFVFMATYVRPEKQENGMISYTPLNSKFGISFTRGEINKGTVKQFDNYYLITDYDKGIDLVHCKIVEDDQGWFDKSKTLEISFSYKNVKVSFSIPGFISPFEDVYETTYTWKFLMSTLNYDKDADEFKWLDADGFQWTMPIEKGEVVLDDEE